ncbi:protein INVOLVED IN DE NOVO 2-like [Hordeum vulgare]|nr:protein INVOLVED IN DE NOVO 2-like [Hordeum vulgare]
MSSDDVPMADAGEVLDAATATSTQAADAQAQQHPTTESALVSDAEQHPAALASDAQQHPTTESALVSDEEQHPAALAADAQQHPTTESALVSDEEQHPAALAADAQQHPAAGSDLGFDAQHHVSAAVKNAEEAIAGEYEMRAAAEREEEQDTRYLIDELAELRIIFDEMIPELNCEDLEEQNQRLRDELEATDKEIERKTERIARLQELEKDNGPTHGALEVNTLDMTGGENKLPVLHEIEKGALEINTLELGGGECNVADHTLMLHENHKQEMEAIHCKLIQLERQLEQRDKDLVLIARQLNMKLQAAEKLPEEDHQCLYGVMTHVRNILDEEVKRMSDSLYLLNREQPNGKELQENRQELIQVFENMPISRGAVFGIKRMGQLDESPFRAACNLKYRDNDPENKAARLVSYWQGKIQKPSWRPFVTIQIKEEDQEVIDDNDPKLSKLRSQYDDNVCNAVKDALRELNEYSPGERCIMNEVWNFREGRKATTTEVITCILEQLVPADPGLRGHEFKVPTKKYSNSI